jgi:hypothetical protein
MFDLERTETGAYVCLPDDCLLLGKHRYRFTRYLYSESTAESAALATALDVVVGFDEEGEVSIQTVLGCPILQIGHGVDDWRLETIEIDSGIVGMVYHERLVSYAAAVGRNEEEVRRLGTHIMPLLENPLGAMGPLERGLRGVLAVFWEWFVGNGVSNHFPFPISSELSRELKFLKEENAALNNELQNAHRAILRKKNARYLASLPSEEELKAIMDEHRFKNGKVNFSSLGRAVGRNHKTVAGWVERLGLTSYAEG